MTAGLSRLRAAQRAKSDERFAERVAHQLQQLRAERAPEEPPIVIDAGPSNFSRAQVPWAVDLAAAPDCFGRAARRPALTDGRTSTWPPGAPGTAPRISSRLRAASTSTTRRFSVVRRTAPM